MTVTAHPSLKVDGKPAPLLNAVFVQDCKYHGFGGEPWKCPQCLHFNVAEFDHDSKDENMDVSGEAACEKCGLVAHVTARLGLVEVATRISVRPLKEGQPRKAWPWWQRMLGRKP